MMVKVALIADRVEHRRERADIVGPHRDVRALFAAVAAEQPDIVIAARTGVDLHRHPVLDTHLCNFGEHLCTEHVGIGGVPLPVTM